MRSIAIVFALLLAACTGGQELAPTTSADATTTTLPSTTGPSTTAEPGSTTSSTQGDTTTTTLPELQGLTYEKVADLPFPVEMTALPGAELSYIATKDGRVWVYDGA